MLPGDVRFLYQRCFTYAEKGSALNLFRFQGYISLSRETHPLHLTFNSASYLQQLINNKNYNEPSCTYWNIYYSYTWDDISKTRDATSIDIVLTFHELRVGDANFDYLAFTRN